MTPSNSPPGNREATVVEPEHIVSEASLHWNATVKSPLGATPRFRTRKPRSTFALPSREKPVVDCDVASIARAT